MLMCKRGGQSIQVDYTLNKEGVAQCKKHKVTDCTNCFAFKKVRPILLLVLVGVGSR